MKFIIFIVLVCHTMATQYVPIQNQYDGVYFGNQSARLHIEAFFDLLCPDSKELNEVFNQIFATLDTNTFHFTYHMFPLPYHINAYSVSIGVKYFQAKFGDKAAIDYINYVFDKQETLSLSATSSLTHVEIIDKFADGVVAHFQNSVYQFTKPQFVAALSNGAYDIALRASWKYGTYRGISGTPIFLVNGVLLDGAESWGYDEWSTFIEIRASEKKRSFLLEMP